MTRKFKVIILLICILIIVFYIIIKLSDMIKKREKLFYDNYTISNILKIELMINDPIILGSYGESYTIELINKKDIKNFMNFINSSAISIISCKSQKQTSGSICQNSAAWRVVLLCSARKVGPKV